jgi:hypothetical protein
MEVVMMKNCKTGGSTTSSHISLVNNNQETLKFVQESMDDMILDPLKGEIKRHGDGEA